MKENGWEPLEPYKNNKAKWTAKCMDCGRVSTPSLGNVLAGRGHCGYCAGNRIDPNEAIEYMQLVGLIPQEDYISATHPWKCICEKCGNLTFPRFADVKLGVRCSTCTNSGMNYSQPSYFYIMTNPELSSIKVGISNNKSRRNRIEHHERSGWLLFFKKDFETGKEASDIENVVLRWLRVEKKLGVHLSEELMPYGGFSETVDAMEITPSEILKFVMSIQRGK
jgi:hypothetical protein